MKIKILNKINNIRHNLGRAGILKKNKNIKYHIKSKFNNQKQTSIQSEQNKQHLFTRDRATSFGTAVPSSDFP